MERSDRHFRYFVRLITQHTLLYTEMITAQAVLRGDRDRLLRYSPEERPLSLQLGGDHPPSLAACARIAKQQGFDEVNLNVGCPSERVQRGRFGACLMLDPDRVADCVRAMSDASDLPVTVKHRIGVDEHDHFEFLATFVAKVASAGCQRFTIHARKAWLTGLSPRQNREIPPLNYPTVYRLKKEFFKQSIEINGGIRNLEEARQHLNHVDAVMIGRAAWENPYLFAQADAQFFDPRSSLRSRFDVIDSMVPYILHELLQGQRPTGLIRNLLNLFAGLPGTKVWKQHLAKACQLSDSEAIRTTILTARDQVQNISEQHRNSSLPVNRAKPPLQAERV